MPNQLTLEQTDRTQFAGNGRVAVESFNPAAPLQTPINARLEGFTSYGQA